MKRLRGLLGPGRLLNQIFEQATANILIQVLGAVTTLSFVHLLPTNDYALFGLCVTTVAFIAITSDLGLMAAMQFFWRGSIAGETDFADRYAAIKWVRLLLFALSGCVATIILGWLQYQQAVPTGSILITLALVLVLAWGQINAQLIVVPLRLSQQLRVAYRAELAGAIVRAGLAVIAFVLALRQAWFPLISLGIASLVTFWLARRHMPQNLREHRPATRENIKATLRYIIPTMPNTILFATQDLFVYWLATLSGGAVVVAESFALGRLAAIFVTLNSIMLNVIIPRVVNLADDRHAHRNGVLPVVIMAGFCAMLTGLAALFPSAVLFVLGKDYANLGTELVLSLGAASFALVAQMLGQLSRVMGWVRWEIPMVLLHAVILIVLSPFFDFSTTEGVLRFNLTIQAIGFLEMLAINIIGRRGITPPSSDMSA